MQSRGTRPEAASTVAVGRQAVIDRDRRVVGYELLYRSIDPDRPPLSGDQMTADVVLSALTIGVGQLVGDKMVFCNAERGVLTGQTPVTLPSHRTVIEVLETVAVDDEIVAGCAALVAEGYTLALDDFVWVEGAERLLDLASIVKLDFRTSTREEIEALARRCSEYDVRLLAEKLETPDELEWAMAAGFELFQGYTIERPQVVHASALPPSVASHVQLAAAMLTEDVDFDELERVLRREPGLVLQVLQLASAGAARGLRREVQTVREALVLLGTVRIRQWVALTLPSVPAPGPHRRPRHGAGPGPHLRAAGGVAAARRPGVRVHRRADVGARPAARRPAGRGRRDLRPAGAGGRRGVPARGPGGRAGGRGDGVPAGGGARGDRPAALGPGHGLGSRLRMGDAVREHVRRLPRCLTSGFLAA